MSWEASINYVITLGEGGEAQNTTVIYGIWIGEEVEKKIT